MQMEPEKGRALNHSGARGSARVRTGERVTVGRLIRGRRKRRDESW